MDAIKQALSNLSSPLREWFMAREPRERKLIVLGLIAIVIGGWYNLLHQPMTTEITKLERRNQADQASLQWMRGAAVQIRAQGGAASTANPGGSLLTLADSSLRRIGLGPALKRIQPEDENNVKIWLENASFNVLLSWCNQIESQGLRISVAGITPADSNTKNGLVKARITLSSGV